MTRISPEDRLDERLMCSVLRLEYDYATLTGTLWLASLHCCDMMGAIGLFRGIDPRVEAIDTYSGDVCDTIYRKQGREWTAYLPKYPTTAATAQEVKEWLRGPPATCPDD